MKSLGTKLFFLSFCILSGVYAIAQEGGTATQTTESHSSSSSVVPETGAMWYTNPIVWVVGGLVFVLILVALLSKRGNVSATEVTRKTTTTTEIKD